MEDIRICYIGDSFVNGVGDPYFLGWSGRLSAMNQNRNQKITHYNLGIRGDTSADILARWEREAEARLPKFSINCAVFSFGLNDTIIEKKRVKVSLVNSMKNIRLILGRAKAKYNVVMIGPPAIDNDKHNARIKTYDEAYATVCNMLGVNYLSIFNKLVDDKEWREEVSLNNHSHPTEKGYDMLAKYIYSWNGWWFI